jgi:hypothetical protein
MKNLVAILGRFGEGKSLKLIELGCKLAETYHLRIVANFPINRAALIQYGKSKGYKWIHNVRVIYFDIFSRAKQLAGNDKKRIGDCLSKAVCEFLNNSHSVLLFDEVGVFMNARGWQAVTIDLLSAIFQLRKENTHLICAFQNFSQVDKQLRENIQEYIYCAGISKYDPKLRLPRLYARFAYYYEPEKFHKKQEVGANGLRSWLMAIKVEWSLFGLLGLFCALESLRRYIFVEIGNIFRFYRGKKPLPYKPCLTDEQRLFLCFKSAKRLDRSPVKAKRMNVTHNGILDVKSEIKSGKNKFAEKSSLEYLSEL